MIFVSSMIDMFHEFGEKWNCSGNFSPMRFLLRVGALTQNALAAIDPRAEWWRLKMFFFEYHSEPNGFDISFDAVAF
jgi:hypothetical protein